MFDSILKIFRRRRIRKYASDVPTGFVPMDSISTVNVVIDAEEAGYELLLRDVLSWGREQRLKVNVLFFDFRKLGKDEQLGTDAEATVTRADLDWIGMPAAAKVGSVVYEPCDLFISMVGNGDFPIEFVSKCAKARFKIGRCGYEGHVYDMVIEGGSGDGNEPRRIFAAIADFIKKVR